MLDITYIKNKVKMSKKQPVSQEYSNNLKKTLEGLV